MSPRTLLALAAALAPLVARSAAPAGAPGWKDDRTWYDGRAEICTYESTRTIYGVARRYEARAYTNKERVDPRTTTKSATEDGPLAFKHHWSERIPTERYDYDFSTMSYVLVDELACWKLQVGTQEDCGASFKELWTEGDRLRFFESTYFPGGGRREGALPKGARPLFFDALTLVLRDFPFREGAERRLSVLPSQRTTRAAPFEPVERIARYAGRETLELPVGPVEAHRVELATPAGAVEARYWFAVEEAPPWLHALVAYEGPEGTSHRLKRIERDAYWER